MSGRDLRLPESLGVQADGRGSRPQSAAGGVLVRSLGELREVVGFRPQSLSRRELAAAAACLRGRLVCGEGWYAVARMVRAPAQPRAVVLYCHGNGGNVALWADALRKLHDRMGVTAMGFDYRGYGRSEGTPSEAGVLADARAGADVAGPAGRRRRESDRADGPLAGRGGRRRSGGRRRPRPRLGKHLHLDARGRPRRCSLICPCGG